MEAKEELPLAARVEVRPGQENLCRSWNGRDLLVGGKKEWENEQETWRVTTILVRRSHIAGRGRGGFDYVRTDC